MPTVPQIPPDHHIQDDYHHTQGCQGQLGGKQVYVVKGHICLTFNALAAQWNAGGTMGT